MFEDAYARQRMGAGHHPLPLGPLRFQLLEYDHGAGFQPYEVVPELEMVRNASGYYLFFGNERLSPESGNPAGKHLRRLDLPAGDYRILVSSPADRPFYQERVIDVPLPSSTTWDLEPAYAYPFPNAYPYRPDLVGQPCGNIQPSGRQGTTLLRGSLHSLDGGSVEGAEVEVVGRSLNRYRTDASGQWVLWFRPDQPSESVAVEVRLPGQVPLVVADVCVVRGRETILGETSLRGIVSRDGIGVAGASVRVLGRPGQTSTGADGRWVYYFELDQASTDVAVTASLPDGSEQTAGSVPVESRKAGSVPTFRF